MYDLVIIWLGSAGLPAWMYASRYKIKNLIIGSQDGWALATSHRVENYPWILSSPGKTIMQTFKEHAVSSWSEILLDQVVSVSRENNIFTVKTNTKEIQSKFLLMATGNNYKYLGVKGEREFLGKWVSYCASCDGMFFKDRTVVVVWGGNTALTEALYLSELCTKVYLVHRKDTFRADDVWIDQVKNKSNIELVLNEEVEEIGGGLFMEEIILKSWKHIKADGIFVAVWTIPNVSLIDSFQLEKDAEGCIVVDKRQETSLKWLYAAGDVTTNSNKFKQTIMSAAEGCLAAHSVHEDLMRHR